MFTSFTSTDGLKTTKVREDHWQSKRLIKEKVGFCWLDQYIVSELLSSQKKVY